MIPATLKGMTVPIDGLKPYRRNPRQGDIGAIVTSLQRHGQYRPIVVNARTQEVLAGNHTLAAARELGWNEIAATFVDVDEDQAARIVLVDNRANDLATYDDQALLDLLQELPDLDGTGFDRDDLDALLADVTGEPAGTPGADTEPAEPPEEPRTVPGTIYTLGDHRLVCGDSTDPATIDALMGDESADLIFTDPPYGMSYNGGRKMDGTAAAKRRAFDMVENDDLTGNALVALVRDALALALARCTQAAAAYVCFTWRTYPEFVEALRSCDRDPKACIVWDKGSIGLGHANYRPQHEFIFYAPGDGGWHGDRAQSDVWTLPRDLRTNYEHPTQKPPALAERAMTNSSAPGDTVLDLFAGSGSTLIAAENLGRAARLVELTPGYCDVIADRWERHTERKAIVKTP